jgi:hypothetical protein
LVSATGHYQFQLVKHDSKARLANTLDSHTQQA